jgi:hypothetical protein
MEWASRRDFRRSRSAQSSSGDQRALDPGRRHAAPRRDYGIDATRPYGKEFPEVAVVPGTDDFEIPGWTDRRR